MWFGVREVVAVGCLLTATVVRGGAQVPLGATARFNHAPFDSLLAAHVRNGLVDYDAFAKAPAFPRYLAALGKAPVASMDEAEQIAFWLNVYNAYTIQLIVQHGERQSIRRINPTLGFLRLKGHSCLRLANAHIMAVPPCTPACAPSSPCAGTRASSTAPPGIESTRCSPPPTRSPPPRTRHAPRTRP